MDIVSFIILPTEVCAFFICLIFIHYEIIKYHENNNKVDYRNTVIA